MRWLKLTWHQTRYDWKLFWRDPASVFFTIILPLIFLFLFVTIFGNEEFPLGQVEVKGSTYYVPGLVVLAVVSATTVNLAISLTILRERGLLKRVRGTPLPPSAVVSARIITSVAVMFFKVALLVGLGRVVYGVRIPTSTLPEFLFVLAVGAATFCALGFAMTSMMPSENSAPPVSNAVVLPLYFISGVFIPLEELPDSVLRVADLFPIKHFFEALLAAFIPGVEDSTLQAVDLAIVAGWGIFGLLATVLTFRWTPSRN